MTLIERPYQTGAHDAVIDYWTKGGGNPLVVLPTGAGKSYQIAKLLRYGIESHPGTRPLVLAHVPELLTQSFQELLQFWPEAPAGLYSASLGKRQIGAQILFAGIQSIHRKASMLQAIDFCIVDEAQMIPRKANTMYNRFLKDLLKINPHMRIVGYTATEFRMDSGMLHEGDDAMFDDIVYKAELRELMDAGYLTPLTSRTSDVQIDTSHVPMAGYDFNQKLLQAAAMDPENINAIADSVLANCEGRKGILVFGSGVEHTKALCEALRERGISSECAFGDTDKGDRNRFVASFKAQRIRALCCYGLFTVGFNAKHVDMEVLARATKSRGLYIQICGRGTRLFPGKKNTLILDFGGNIALHGPVDDPKPVKSKKGEGGSAPFKNCPQCATENHASARMCWKCDFQFPEPVSKIATEASTLDILSTGKHLTPEWIDVDNVTYDRHAARDTTKPNSLKVTYRCGLLWHSEYICLEHGGMAKIKATAWWKRRATAGTTIPKTIGQALDLVQSLDKPRQISVRLNGKFTEIVGYRQFGRDVAMAA